jgi:integrase
METTVTLATENASRRERGTGRVFRRGNVLWIQFYDGRKHRCQSVAPAIRELQRLGKKVDESKVAEQLLRKRLAEKENGLLAPQRQSRVTVSELYEDELAYLLDGKPKTAAWLKSRWELRLSDYFGARRAREIRYADLVAYRTQRQAFYRKAFPSAGEKKIRACDSAINSDMAALRMMFYRGKELDKLDLVPNFPHKLSGALEREGTVTPEQFDAMLTDCGPDELWLRTFLTMTHNWGYRLRELLNLQCVRVSLRDKTVYLPPRSTKNKQPRLVPISDEEIPLLKACMAGKMPQDFVLTRADGKRVLDFRKRWEQIVETAKAGHSEIDLQGNATWCPAIPHDLRRTAVSRLLSGGMPPEAVRAVVGHISPEMTQRYYKPAIDTLRRLQRAAVAQLEVLAKDPENTQIPGLPFEGNSSTISNVAIVSTKQAL